MGVVNNISSALGFGASAQNEKVKVVANVNKNVINKNVVKNKTTQLVPQTGGVAPVNYRYPANMQQPSEEIMEWATTADAPTPTSGMRNVAHGGAKRKTHKRVHKRHHRSMKRKSHKRRRHHRSMKRKSHKRHSRK